MTSSADAVLALIDRHLASSTPPCDPGVHYDTYAPDALLIIGSQALPRAKAARSDYITAWQRLLKTMQPAESGAHLVRESVEAVAHDPTGVRVATTLRDVASGQCLPVAWLVEASGTGPAIRAVCPLDGPLPDADTLIAHHLAELAHWGNHFDHPVWPMSAVGMAWERLFGTEPLPLESLPEARFTCQNRGDCCRMGTWTIPVDPNTERALSAVPWEALGLQGPQIGPVTAQPGAHGIVAGSTGQCEAHVGTRCTVHQAMGWQPIHTCQIFPYQFQMAPDAIIVTASYQCLTVGDNQGAPLSAQAADILTRMRPVRHLLIRLPEAVPLYPDGPTIPWSTYRRLESAMLATLADRNLGDLASRVQAVSQGLGHLLAMAREGRTCPIALAGVDTGSLAGAAGVSDEAAEAWMSHLCSGEWDQPQRRPFDGWRQDAWKLSRQGRIGTRRDDELATRYVRTVAFRKLGLGSFGVAFSWGLTAMAACLWDRHTVYRYLHDGLPIERELQLDTAQRLDHSLMHTPLVQAIGEDPALVRQLCDPQTWLSFAAVSG
jgi:hypothetical protein